MKWMNEGKEFDEVYTFWKEKLKNTSSVIIYGAGFAGKMLAENLETFLDIKVRFFVDRNAENIKSWRGIPVYTVEDMMKYKCTDEIILVSVNYYVANEVVIALRGKGLIEWKDFCVIERLRNLFDVYERDYLTLGLAEFPITERCTLNCRKCSFFTPYYKNPRDFSYEQIIRDIDLFFEKVDYVEVCRFLGGEPFLCKWFLDVLKYLEENYRERYSEVAILTNATILPSAEFLDFVSKRPHYFIGITDYTRAVDYKKRIKEFTDAMEEHKIRYYKDDSKSWCDLGFPEQKDKVTHEEAEQIFQRCGMHCRTIHDGKLWHCAFTSSASRAGLIEPVNKTDYLELDKVKSKKEIFEFYLGYSKSGTNTLCYYCKITEGKIIPCGEQMEVK